MYRLILNKRGFISNQEYIYKYLVMLGFDKHVFKEYCLAISQLLLLWIRTLHFEF